MAGPLTRWEPSSTLTRLRNEMNRLFEDFFGETAEERTPMAMLRSPNLDVKVRDQDVLVRAEMPGIDTSSLSIEVTPDTLSLRAEMKKEEEKKGEHFIRHERQYSAFQRVVPLPVEVKPDDTRATYKDGVLEITLPKSEQAKTHTVKVNVE